MVNLAQLNPKSLLLVAKTYIKRFKCAPLYSAGRSKLRRLNGRYVYFAINQRDAIMSNRALLLPQALPHPPDEQDLPFHE